MQERGREERREEGMEEEGRDFLSLNLFYLFVSVD